MSTAGVTCNIELKAGVYIIIKSYKTFVINTLCLLKLNSVAWVVKDMERASSNLYVNWMGMLNRNFVQPLRVCTMTAAAIGPLHFMDYTTLKNVTIHFMHHIWKNSTWTPSNQHQCTSGPYMLNCSLRRCIYVINFLTYRGGRSRLLVPAASSCSVLPPDQHGFRTCSTTENLQYKYGHKKSIIIHGNCVAKLWLFYSYFLLCAKGLMKHTIITYHKCGLLANLHRRCLSQLFAFYAEVKSFFDVFACHFFASWVTWKCNLPKAINRFCSNIAFAKSWMFRVARAATHQAIPFNIDTHVSSYIYDRIKCWIVVVVVGVCWPRAKIVCLCDRRSSTRDSSDDALFLGLGTNKYHHVHFGNVLRIYCQVNAEMSIVRDMAA